MAEKLFWHLLSQKREPSIIYQQRVVVNVSARDTMMNPMVRDSHANRMKIFLGNASGFLLAALILCLSASAQAQDDASVEKNAKAPLKLELSTPTPVLCIDAPLVLELEITNAGQEDVEIDNSNLWKGFSFSISISNPDGIGRAGAIGIGNSGGRGEKIILHPGMTYKSKHEFSLAFDFFQEAGDYELSTRYEGIYSNVVTFALHQCGAPKEIKEQNDDGR